MSDLLDYAHVCAAHGGSEAARMEEVLAGLTTPAVVEPDRETWGTTPDAVEGRRAMESLFAPAKPKERPT